MATGVNPNRLTIGQQSEGSRWAWTTQDPAILEGIVVKKCYCGCVGGYHLIGCPYSGTNLPDLSSQETVLSFQELQMLTDTHNQQEIDALNGIITALRDKDGKASTREKALAVTKLEEAIMWLEKDAKLNQKSP